MLSDEEVSGIFSDALARYANAFGGKTEFFAWLDPNTERARSDCKGQPESSCPPTYYLFKPDLRKMLDQFRKQ
jgi:hypothetical protein